VAVLIHSEVIVPLKMHHAEMSVPKCMLQSSWNDPYFPLTVYAALSAQQHMIHEKINLLPCEMYFILIRRMPRVI